MKRRARLAPESLTSLVDVLFILVFAALVQRAGATATGAPAVGAAPATEVAPAPAQASPDWAPPAQAKELRRQAERELTERLRERPAVVARVSARGVLTSLEISAGSSATLAALLLAAAGADAGAAAGDASDAGAAVRRLALELPLIEKVADPDVGVGYIADRDPARHLCDVAAARLGPLAQSLVILTVDAPLSELMVALVAGLRRDVEHCLTAHRAAAVLLDPSAPQGPP